jgi:DNA-binding response OmpR family regulator
MTMPLDLRDRTILIVDDTPVNLTLAVAMLKQQGLRLSVAHSGDEALQRVAFAPPDLILLDVMLPGIDGFEVCRCLKAGDGPGAAVPVIFMTALKDTADKLAGFKAGAVDYVTKPLQAEEVLARVTTHLRLAAMQAQLTTQNALLATENQERREVERVLQQYRDSLELEVAARTAEVRELGIGSALEWLVDKFRKHSGVDCSLTLALEEGQLSERQVIDVFRIVQESLTNVARHADANEAAATLSYSGRHCELQVKDDGCGFDMTGVRPHLHHLHLDVAINAIPPRHASE